MQYDFENSHGRLTHLVSKGMGSLIEQLFHENNLPYSSDEWTVLAYLYSYKRQHQKELSIATGKNKVAITRMLLKLEKQDVLIRNREKGDKRYNSVELTEKGNVLYEKMLPLVEQVMIRIYNNFTEAEIRLLSDGLKKVYSNIVKNIQQLDK